MTTSENPYQTPAEGTPSASPSPKLLLWSMAAVFGSTLVGAVFGVIVGITIAAVAPGYYRAVMSSGSEAWFDPQAVGIGLGLSEGAIGGTVVGLILVALFYWYRSRTARG